MKTLAEIQKALQSPAEKPENGFYTAREWARNWGLSGQRARDLLLQAIEKNKAERKVYRVSTARGIYPTPHYRFLSP